MKPLQIFFLVNILFFFFLSNVDLFRIPAELWQRSDYALSQSLKSTAEAKANQLGVSIAEIGSRYDGISNSFAKGFVVVFIPILALVFCVLFFKKRYQVGKHIVFASHFFSFVLLLLVLWSMLLDVLFNEVSREFFIYPVMLFILSYLALAIRKFYQVNLFLSAISAAFIFLIMLQGIEIYRELISTISMAYVK